MKKTLKAWAIIGGNRKNKRTICEFVDETYEDAWFQMTFSERKDAEKTLAIEGNPREWEIVPIEITY